MVEVVVRPVERVGRYGGTWTSALLGPGDTPWLDKTVQYDSAGASVKQVTLDHTHYETVIGCAAATELYGKVFKPTIHREIYAFEDLPRAMHEMHRNTQTGIPIIRVAKEMLV